MWFYFAINIGALISTFTLPLVTKHLANTQHAYAIAFQFPAWLMVAALSWSLQPASRFYAEEQSPTINRRPKSGQSDWRTLLKLGGVFGLIFFFWVGYEFNDNIWIYFIRDYVNLNVDFRLDWPGRPDVEPAQLQVGQSRVRDDLRPAVCLAL